MEERDLQTSEKILRAALELFAEHGLDGVSVRKIAAAAGANVAAVNYYFGSKQALYMRALRRVFYEFGHELPPDFRVRTEAATTRAELLDLFEQLLKVKLGMFFGHGGNEQLKQRLLLRALLDDTLSRELIHEFAEEHLAQTQLFRKLNPELTELQATLAVFTHIGQLAFYVLSRTAVLGILRLPEYTMEFQDELIGMIRQNLTLVLNLPQAHVKP
jgi:AcrR family transcriptional regulator